MTELFGRLAPGVDLETARAELRAVHGAIVKEHPEAYPAKADFRIDAVRLRDQIISPARTVLLVLLAASALVFVIACSNVANLILARSVRREGELAIRAALGASAGALRRTLLAESLLLCGAGAVLGVAHRAADGGGPGALCRALLGARARPHRRRDACCGSASVLALAAAVLLAFVPRLPSAERVERPRAVERQRAHHVGHQPPPARLRGDADRRVVRAARRRRHAADDARSRCSGANRLRHAQRAGGERAGRVVHAARRSRSSAFYKEAMRRDRASCPASSASRSARSCRGATPAASVRGSSSRSRAMRRRTAKRIRGRASARSRPDSSPRSACRSSPAATSPTPIAATPRRSSSSARAWRSGMFPNQDAVNRRLMWTDPVMKFIDVSTDAAAHRRRRRRRGRRERRARTGDDRLSPARAGDRRRPPVRARAGRIRTRWCRRSRASFASCRPSSRSSGRRRSKTCARKCWRRIG